MSARGSDGGLRNTLYRTNTRSSRRLSASRRLLHWLAVPLASGVIRAWWLTTRVVHVEGARHLEEALETSPSLIPCYWHQHQLYCAKFLLDQRTRGLKMGWLVSPSVDGELGAILVNRFGGVAIRGSSTHTGARALRDYYQALVKENVSPVITPDGPRGPRFKFKPGALLLAQMSGRPILPLSYAASRAWLVKWDKFVIPVPVSRVAIVIGPPRFVPRVLDAASLEQFQDAMAEELKRLYGVARAALEPVRRPG
jgi:lysophospholipid acyltransferase (LPLAT)-like uncharacterized protein